VSCGLTGDELVDFLPWPRPGGIGENAAVAKKIARSCAEHAGSRLRHSRTVDLDLVRWALSEDRISYLGYSYSTYPRRRVPVALPVASGPDGA
jgi:hypothetical protein